MPSGWRKPCPRVNFARRAPEPGPPLLSARPTDGGGARRGHPLPAAPGRPGRQSPRVPPVTPIQLARTCPRAPQSSPASLGQHPPAWPRGTKRRRGPDLGTAQIGRTKRRTSGRARRRQVRRPPRLHSPRREGRLGLSDQSSPVQGGLSGRAR